MNPGLPPSGKATVESLPDNWGKLFAVAMLKLGQREIVITAADLKALGEDGEMAHCLVVQELSDGLHIRLLSVDEAVREAARLQGGARKS